MVGWISCFFLWLRFSYDDISWARRFTLYGTCLMDGRVTWLILPVVICLFQRLSHACLSIYVYIETVDGSL